MPRSPRDYAAKAVNAWVNDHGGTDILVEKIAEQIAQALADAKKKKGDS